jgi:perosamine synthetase
MIPHSRPCITNADLQSVHNCMQTAMIARGNRTAEFEKKLQKYFNAGYVRTTASGTSALILALKTLGISNKNDEVLLPTYVCSSVAEAVLFCGGQPVFYDNTTEWISGAAAVESRVTKNTKTIIVVHIMGMKVNDLEKIIKIGIPVIEDVCQAFGAKHNDSFLGTLGDIGVFSFHATKCLTTGEGGAIVTNKKELAAKIENNYRATAGAYTFTDVQAELGLSQLSQYGAFLEKRSAIAHAYFDGIKLKAADAYRHYTTGNIFFRFLLTVQAPFEKIKQEFAEKGVAVRKGVDDLLHRKYNLSDELFGQAVTVFNKTVSLPLYPALADSEVEYIINVTNQIVARYEN